jgi:hypothetical protein
MNCRRIRKTGYDEIQRVELQEPQWRKDLLPHSSGLQYGYITLQMHGNKVTVHGVFPEPSAKDVGPYLLETVN